MKRHIQTATSASWHRGSARLLVTALCALASTAGNAHAGDTVRVSVSDAGIAADADSNVPAIDRTGRIVAFISAATNLTPGDTNAADDVFVHDRK